jgi:IclR family KDG regulon transcriptional repressor
MRLPLLAGAGGKALLCQLSDEEIDHILAANPLKQFTRKTCINQNEFKKEVVKIREDGIAFDDEGYIAGVVAFAEPLKAYRQDLPSAIWTVGLKQQVSPANVPKISEFLKTVAA